MTAVELDIVWDVSASVSHYCTLCIHDMCSSVANQQKNAASRKLIATWKEATVKNPCQRADLPDREQKLSQRVPTVPAD